MPLEVLTGIEDPLTAAAVLLACVLAVMWVLDLYGIFNFGAWINYDRGGGGDGGGGDGGGGGGE